MYSTIDSVSVNTAISPIDSVSVHTLLSVLYPLMKCTRVLRVLGVQCKLFIHLKFVTESVFTNKYRLLLLLFIILV